MNIVFKKESPLFTVFIKDFEKLFAKNDETRLYIYKKGENFTENNPIKNIIPIKENNDSYTNFDYEYLLIKKHKERLLHWVKESDIILPPTEIEIQPINYCNLKCLNCIGKYLDYYSVNQKCLNPDDVNGIGKLLEWTYEGFKIEKIRISGLSGDPLADAAIPFTKALIKKNNFSWKKETVLFTNGINIDKVLDDLLKVDTVHISIDAGNAETYYKIKGLNEFDKVTENIRKLKNKIRSTGSETKIGVGFVATQKNCGDKEINDFTKFVNSDLAGVDFVRYKRDIHMPNSISWRSWCELKSKIINQGNTYITDMPRQHWGGDKKKCKSDKYSLTIGADGNIYTCDHITNKPEMAIGTIKDINLDSIKNNISSASKISETNICSQCPPFNYRFNHFISQIDCIYKYRPKEFDDWIIKDEYI
jgi:MoaA/NifB/PqqE/SkfB family radical SAM enzyme